MSTHMYNGDSESSKSLSYKTHSLCSASLRPSLSPESPLYMRVRWVRLPTQILIVALDQANLCVIKCLASRGFDF